MSGMSQEEQGVRDSPSMSSTPETQTLSAQCGQPTVTAEDEVYRETIWPGHWISQTPLPRASAGSQASHFNIPHRAPDTMRAPEVNTSRDTRTHPLPGKSESLLLRTILILFM